jgi:DNA polymerase elongation subunit (family B)
VIYDNVYDLWESTKGLLSSTGYKLIPAFPLDDHPSTVFKAIAESIAPPNVTAESSDPPFIIAVFVSGLARSSALESRHGSVDIYQDVIKPFLPESAPHLQQVPKLFFISVDREQYNQPVTFPDDSNGNYFVVYHETESLEQMLTWKATVDDVFCLGKSAQELIEKSKSYMHLHGYKNKERLHYFSCLKNNFTVK